MIVIEGDPDDTVRMKRLHLDNKTIDTIFALPSALDYAVPINEGKGCIYSIHESQADVWLVENFDPAVK